jgi:hypothetical protein
MAGVGRVTVYCGVALGIAVERKKMGREKEAEAVRGREGRR